MSVQLPTLPRASEVKERYIDFGGALNPPLGGAGQYIGRLGSRFGVDVQLPKLSIDDARAFIAARLKAKAEAQTLSLAWPQPALSLAIGAPVADGADQLGARLNVSGLTAGLVIPATTFFSFAAGGRNFLHATTTEVTASGGGTVQLHIAPLLRASPGDGADLEFEAPLIEGFLDGPTIEWSLERLRWSQTSFVLVENE